MQRSFAHASICRLYNGPMDTSSHKLPRVPDTAHSPQRDWLLWGVLGTAILMLVAALIPLILASRMSHRHHTYLLDLSGSLVYAQDHGSLSATRDGEPLRVTSSQVSRLYEELADAGMGHPCSEEPAGGTCLTFGDGSSLSLWAVPITEGGRAYDEGVAVRYVRADGWAFCYDTDQARYDDLVGTW